MKATVGNPRILELTERLIKASSGDDRGARRAKRLLAHLRAKPMSVILRKVPGASAVQKAKRIGVTRQTFYYWRDGITRPNKIQAKKLSKITGYASDVIRGLA